MPWSARDDGVVFWTMPEPRSAADSTPRLDGVTMRHGREAAPLTCFRPYNLTRRCSGRAHRGISCHLATDEPLAGEARQSAYIASLLRSDGRAMPMNRRFDTSVELAEEECDDADRRAARHV